MARQEQDREDLFAEATAYSIRGELISSERNESVFVGLKDSGLFSFYFGADPVYHFTEAGQIRRAFVDGELYRTQGQTLARLQRKRTEDSSHLLRKDLTEVELQTFLSNMLHFLSKLKADIQRSIVIVTRATVPEVEFQKSVLELCDKVLSQAEQLAPRIRGKR
ncbi:hypothetical protein [Rubinisphaera italica]|uniref:Uncharacterized protein n=1 Tax=Rubinisphaera italica TaxID=2527969 RepID=A0A5C5XNN5_9PLAN|nr:hypothetical protein [Rubinisphaera italica]TWT63695.1 hypothetical protein Pan54_44530 [Rubinisphaera italica]